MVFRGVRLFMAVTLQFLIKLDLMTHEETNFHTIHDNVFMLNPSILTFFLYIKRSII